MKIYTKKGDQGYTTNVLGESCLKSDLFMELQGSIDEINAHIGVLRSKVSNIPDHEGQGYIDDLLKTIQYNLYEIGAELSNNFKKLYIEQESVQFLEENIDEITKKVPPLNSFLYYSGVEESVYCHVIRTVVRRVERVFVRFNESRNVREYSFSYQYVNRLSDLFFTLARYINFISGKEEEAMKINK